MDQISSCVLYSSLGNIQIGQIDCHFEHCNIVYFSCLLLCVVFFLLTDSLCKTTLDSSRCPAVFEKALDCCFWSHCPTEEASNCFKSHRLLQLRYVGGTGGDAIIYFSGFQQSSNEHIFTKCLFSYEQKHIFFICLIIFCPS